MARCLQVLFAALSVFALLQIGECLKCYDCVGKPGEDCDNPAKFPDFKKECPNEPDVACYFRNTSLLEGAGQIVRNCGRKNHCPTPKGSDFNTTCFVCEKDLCNTSSNVLPSVFFAGIVAVIFAKMYL